MSNANTEGLSDSQNALTVLQQQVTALAAPDATMNDIGAQLGALWDAAEAADDDRAKAYLSAAWEKTQALAQTTTAANAIAAAALETAQQFAVAATAAEQRADLAVEQLETVYEDAYSDAVDGVMDQLVNGYNGEIYLEEPGHEVFNVLEYEYQRGRDDAASLQKLVYEDDCDVFLCYIAGRTRPMPGALAEKVARFIHEFSVEYRRLKTEQDLEYMARISAKADRLMAEDDQRRAARVTG